MSASYDVTSTTAFYGPPASPMCRTVSLAMLVGLVVCLFCAVFDAVNAASESRRRHAALHERLIDACESRRARAAAFGWSRGDGSVYGDPM